MRGRSAHLEKDGTLWVVNEKKRIAFETTEKKQLPEAFIYHNMSERHPSAYIELFTATNSKEIPIPKWIKEKIR